MKTYGESTYKGFVFLADPKNKKKPNKHFISHVTYHSLDKTYSIYVRGPGSDLLIDGYKFGSNPRADIGIKAWNNARRKNGKRGILHV